MSRPERSRRSDYRHFTPLTTRWADNDVFGHVNNVMYYNWFDTAVTGHLLEKNLMDPLAGEVQTLVVETGCSYFSSVAFPDAITIGIAITDLGTSSMRYAIGIFRENEDLASAQGHLIHVAVARATGRPVPLPDFMRQGLESIRRLKA